MMKPKLLLLTQSFATRLTWKILVAVLVIMIVFLVISLASAHHSMRAETYGRYLGFKNVVSAKLESILKTEEIGGMHVCDESERNLDSPEAVMTVLQNNVGHNDYVKGYFAAFEPDYYQQKGKWFEPYAYKQDDEYVMAEIGSERHDYLNTDWYIRAKKETTGFWTAPYEYLDEAGKSHALCTFVLPIHDNKGRFVGVCGTDMSLKWLSEELKKIDITSKDAGLLDIDDSHNFIDFYTMIIDHDGTFIAHPDKNRVMKENMLSCVDRGKDSLNLASVVNATSGGGGICTLTIDGTLSTVYYAPIGFTDWHLLIVVPKEAISRPIFILLTRMVLLTLIGLLIIWMVCRQHIRQATKPLIALTRSADEVAKGNFEAPLPVLENKDEICELRDSFAMMQSSLKKYIQDLKDTTARKAAMESELRVAYKLQMSMIPNKFPPFPKRSDIDIFGSLTPAKAVGGDLFDYFIRDEHLFFCIGDVSGKGVPAALMMTVAHYLFRIISSQTDDPGRIVNLMNDSYANENSSMMFCTFFLGVLDLKTGLLKYCNAGHEVPFLIKETVERLPVETNMALGVMGDMSFEVQEIHLSKDSLLFFYTDGLTDATSPDDHRFGIERVQDVLQACCDENLADAKAYVSRMTDEVASFVKNADQADDLTMLLIRC